MEVGDGHESARSERHAGGVVSPGLVGADTGLVAAVRVLGCGGSQVVPDLPDLATAPGVVVEGKQRR